MFGALGVSEAAVDIMYATDDLPPSIVTIPKAKYSLEAEASAIREDLAKRRGEKPEIREV